MRSSVGSTTTTAASTPHSAPRASCANSIEPGTVEERQDVAVLLDRRRVDLDAHAALARLGRGIADHVALAHLALAADGAAHEEQALEQRGLAAAVGADQCDAPNGFASCHRWLSPIQFAAVLARALPTRFDHRHETVNVEQATGRWQPKMRATSRRPECAAVPRACRRLCLGLLERLLGLEPARLGGRDRRFQLGVAPGQRLDVVARQPIGLGIGEPRRERAAIPGQALERRARPARAAWRSGARRWRCPAARCRSLRLPLSAPLPRARPSRPSR